jgi:flagellar basal body rod protein FlgG
MDVTLYQAAAGMNASSRWQEIIADNLSATQLPGFKKQEVSFSAVQAGYLARTAGAAPAGTQRFVMPLAGSSTNMRPGELRPSGGLTDLAIEGPGFFEVQLPGGNLGYTRDGEFRLNGQGQLVTKQGLPVMAENGPVQVDPRNTGKVAMAPNGDILQDNMLRGRLKVVEFADPAALTASPTGLFLALSPAAQPLEAKNSLVRQGLLESANVSSVVEMGSLVTAMRFYEANQKVVHMEDERLGRLINEVGNPA